jgi:alpha-1,3-rhamnosyl/mannosyltransferase
VLVCGTVLSQGTGGVRRHNQELLPRVAKLLEACGGSLAVLAGRDGLAFELPSSIEVLPSRVPPAPALTRFAHESRALRDALDSARRAGRAFDLVHTGHLPAPRGLDVPFTLTLHDLKSVALPSEPLLRRLAGRKVVRDAVARARLVLCVSRTLADEVRELTACDAAKLRVVPNGCDHLGRLPRAPAEPRFVLCVGRLEPRKNVELLLRAWAHDASLPKLLLAGGSRGEHELDLRRRAQELGVGSRIEFPGECDDARLSQLYATCTAVVLPSLREGFDLPLVEALHAGAPLAASDLPVHRELAGPGVRFFDPRSPEACAAAIHDARPATAMLATWSASARDCANAWWSV